MDVATIVRRVFEEAIRSGRLRLDDKTDEQIVSELEAFLAWIQKDPSIEFQAVIDHSNDLETQAKDMLSHGHRHTACLLYATWFEHWLNGMLRSAATRCGVGDEDTTLMLREASLRAKTSWLLRVLNLPPLNQAHKNLALKVVDLRNGYVHYKWQPKGDGPSQTDLELDKCLTSVEKTIAYLKHYESAHSSVTRRASLSTSLKTKSAVLLDRVLRRRTGERGCCNREAIVGHR